MASQIRHVKKARIKKHPSALTQTRADADRHDRFNRVDIPGRVKNFEEGASPNG